MAAQRLFKNRPIWSHWTSDTVGQPSRPYVYFEVHWIILIETSWIDLLINYQRRILCQDFKTVQWQQTFRWFVLIPSFKLKLTHKKWYFWAVVVAQLTMGVASNTRVPVFESSHLSNIYWTCFLLTVWRKDENKAK